MSYSPSSLYGSFSTQSQEICLLPEEMNLARELVADAWNHPAITRRLVSDQSSTLNCKTFFGTIWAFETSKPQYSKYHDSHIIWRVMGEELKALHVGLLLRLVRRFNRRVKERRNSASGVQISPPSLDPRIVCNLPSSLVPTLDQPGYLSSEAEGDKKHHHPSFTNSSVRWRPRPTRGSAVDIPSMLQADIGPRFHGMSAQTTLNPAFPEVDPRVWHTRHTGLQKQYHRANGVPYSNLESIGPHYMAQNPTNNQQITSSSYTTLDYTLQRDENGSFLPLQTRFPSWNNSSFGPTMAAEMKPWLNDIDSEDNMHVFISQGPFQRYEDMQSHQAFEKSRTAVSQSPSMTRSLYRLDHVDIDQATHATVSANDDFEALVSR
ncbi:hypothetical protein FB446DRAFT_844806 [Lentinula raphanica]|nr:hypothetical protein FB446DRAFT_844806 [Lentinula raphanica]